MEGYERMLTYLATVGPAFVVAKIEDINGVQFYTLATTNGQVINENLKNVLLGIEPTVNVSPVQVPSAVVQQPQAVHGNVNYNTIAPCLQNWLTAH